MSFKDARVFVDSEGYAPHLLDMTAHLDPVDHPWVTLLSPDELADMREDLVSGVDAGHCSHGTPIDEVVGLWSYFTLDEMQPPVDWVDYDVSVELWFTYLDKEDAAMCRAEFAAASTDEERTQLFWGWRSTGAIRSDPILTARLLEPIDDSFDGAVPTLR